MELRRYIETAGSSHCRGGLAGRRRVGRCAAPPVDRTADAAPDLHATVLHLLGIDHTRLTFRHNGSNRRLTDVHGQVIPALLA